MTLSKIDEAIKLAESLVADKCRGSFWFYCKKLAPDFYIEGRTHLKILCDTLQSIYEERLLNDNGEPYKKLIIQMPPRHGKSRTLIMFVSWILGKKETNKIITTSFNDSAASDFSRYTRDTITQTKNTQDGWVFSDIFSAKIKYGNASFQKWALEGQFFNYIGSGVRGTITSKGGNCFPAGTMIYTPSGYKDIACLQNNERVLSYNHERNKTEWKKIKATKQRVSNRLVTITLPCGDSLTATSDHRIFLSGKGYTEIENACVGDNVKVLESPKSQHKRQFDCRLPSLSCDTSQIESKSIQNTRSEIVYDIQVEDNNNFFANGILVHNCLIIDDPIKGAENAYNELDLDRTWQWYTGTFMSRGEHPIEILCQTPWASKDLGGRLIAQEPELWYLLSMPACTDGEMLCPDILNHKEYLRLKKTGDENIIRANYDMIRLDVKGSLYGSGLQTYTELPENIDARCGYTDTADEGQDYLCAIVGVKSGMDLFITDVLYTQDAQETTEPQTVDLIRVNDTRDMIVESNSGGRAFARNIDRMLREKGSLCSIDWFHQGANKVSRINTNASIVKSHVFFPEDWATRWPEFYLAMISYQRTGKNKHDDAPDCVTGLCEKFLVEEGYGCY